MLKRRVPRLLATGFVLAVAVSGLSACRTAPNVAAYVGDGQITVAELDAAVEERLEDEVVAAFVEGNEEQFTRRVLTLLVQEEVYAAAAERFDVQVDNDDVRARIDELLGDDDPEDVYSQLAEQGIGRTDVFENVHQQLVRREVAAAEGQAEGLDTATLQARYAEVRESLAEVSFGYITVPDEATAAAVLAALTAAPTSYATVAAQYPGAYTLPALEARGPDEIPAVLAEGIAAAQPNTGFITPVPEAAGVVVTFVEGTVYPTFEEVRPQLEQEAGDQADQAGTTIIEDVREDLGVTLNPRFEEEPEDGNGVVDILEDDATSPPSDTPAG